jgi:hypothetical protein
MYEEKKRVGKYLNFEKEEKGFELFEPTKENLKANIGKRICYVDFVEPYRGTYFVRYGRIHSMKYSRLYLNDGDREIDVRDIIECGIEIETTK